MPLTLRTRITTRTCGCVLVTNHAMLSRPNYLMFSETALSGLRTLCTKSVLLQLKCKVPCKTKKTSLFGKIWSTSSISLLPLELSQRSTLLCKSSMVFSGTLWITWFSTKMIWPKSSKKLFAIRVWTLSSLLFRLSQTCWALLSARTSKPSLSWFQTWQMLSRRHLRMVMRLFSKMHLSSSTSLLKLSHSSSSHTSNKFIMNLNQSSPVKTLQM